MKLGSEWIVLMESAKREFSKFIVTLVIILNVLFTIAVLYVFIKVENEPSILIGSWFSFTTVELLALAFIKIKKKEDNE